MQSSGPLFHQYKALFARQLADNSRTAGSFVVGICIEGALAAIVEYLQATRGPRGAFDLISRYADKAIAPALPVDPTTEKGDVQ
jgi:hypothetical protein